MPEPQWSPAEELFKSLILHSSLTVEEIERVLQHHWDDSLYVQSISNDVQEDLNIIRVLKDVHETVTEQNKFILQLQGQIDKLTASLNAQKPSRSRKKTDE